MSSNIVKTLKVSNGSGSRYFSKSGNLTLDGTVGSFQYTMGVGAGTTGDGTYNNAAKNILFPNSTAHPTKLELAYWDGEAGIGSSHASSRFYIGSTQMTNQQMSTSKRNRTFSSTNSTVTGMTKSSTLKWHLASGSLMGGGIGDVEMKLTFIQYDFAAVGMTGVSASVNADNGFDGDTITWTAIPDDGYAFNGWYSDSSLTTLVSTEAEYSETVSGADKTLYAKVTAGAFKTLWAAYKQKMLIKQSVPGSVAVTYNGSTISTIASGTKTLNCKAKKMASNVGIGNKTLNCNGRYMDDNVVVTVAGAGQGYSMQNLLSVSSMSLGIGVTVADGVFTFQAGDLRMVTQTLPTPTVGHLYYGRVDQKAPPSSTYPDGRFEYYGGDGTGKNIIFTSFADAIKDNEWHSYSAIMSFPSLSGENWALRSFTVSGTDTAYRRNHLIIDLTAAFGSGNEPRKNGAMRTFHSSRVHYRFLSEENLLCYF